MVVVVVEVVLLLFATEKAAPSSLSFSFKRPSSVALR